MTDRELLEAAARAAGNSASWDCEELADSDSTGQGMFFDGKRTPDNSKYWNPLTCDGDAFRLMVQLRMDVVQFKSAVRVSSPQDDFYLEHDADPYAATRRAIVRAAASMAQGEMV